MTIDDMQRGYDELYLYCMMYEMFLLIDL